MKKTILIAAFTAVTTITMGQVRFGIQAGPNISMGRFRYNDAAFNGSVTHEQKNQVNLGFVGGFVAEIPLSSSIAFRPELNYSRQGTKYTYSVNYGLGTGEVTQKINLSYIQVPLNFVYKVPAGTGSLFFGLGPSLELGLTGTNKISSSTDPTDPDYNKNIDIKFDGKKLDDIDNGNGDDRGHLKRFDVGANALVGYQMGMGLFMKVGYTHGLIDINPDKVNADIEDRASFKNKGLYITLGYTFGGSGMKKK